MKFRNYIADQLGKAGMHSNADEWIRNRTISSALTAVVAAVLTLVLGKGLALAAVVFTLSAIGVAFFFLFGLSYASYRRAEAIEGILPEALELIGSGIRAGLPVRNAIESVTRPEFEPLSEEISRAFVEETTGVSLEESLLNSSKRISSPLYEKSIGTLVKSIHSGVNIDRIAASLSKNINEIRNVRKEIKSSTVSYTLFLTFAALLASPLLFSLSSFLVQSNVLLGAQSGITDADVSGIPGSFASVFSSAPPVDALNKFFLIAIIVVSISTSIAVGIVGKGSYKEGIKISPFFVAFGVAMFYISKTFVSRLFIV